MLDKLVLKPYGHNRWTRGVWVKKVVCMKDQGHRLLGKPLGRKCSCTYCLQACCRRQVVANA